MLKNYPEVCNCIFFASMLDICWILFAFRLTLSVLLLLARVGVVMQSSMISLFFVDECDLTHACTCSWIQGHPEYGFGFKAVVCHDGVCSISLLSFLVY